MYKVTSPEWNIIIKDGFESFKKAHHWARENCGESSVWEGIWEVEYYDPNPFRMWD